MRRTSHCFDCSYRLATLMLVLQAGAQPAFAQTPITQPAPPPPPQNWGGLRGGGEQNPSTTVQIGYELHYNPAPQAMQWEIRIRVTGLDATQRDVTLSLGTWGGWTSVDTLYLRALGSAPPIHPHPDVPDRFIIDAPTDWDGTLDVSYYIPLTRYGSNVYSRYQLLPWQTDTYACGFSSNTLMRVLRNGQPMEARRTITLTAPPGTTIASGWAGVSMERQGVTLAHDIDNALILFGTSPRVARAEEDGVLFEVAQFQQGPDVTAALLRLASTLILAYGRTTGQRIDRPVRIFITHGGGGGTRTDHGLVVGFNTEATDLESPNLKLLIAHELFHEWLGGYLKPEPDDESLSWFYEGFTDYLALWHLVSTGLVGPDGFAQRLMELDDVARSSPAYGRVAFADTSVRWRDDSGPNERLAYQGGGLLAFFIDFELRAQGRPGLPEMIADLLRQTDGKYSLESLRSWLEAHGLAEFYEKYMQAAALPNLHAALTALGYEAERAETALTYLGIRTDADTQRGQVTAIDPDGPAATTALQVGDRIRGYFPARFLKPSMRETVDTPYRFGLNLIEPGDPGTFIDVIRGDQEMTIKIQPRVITGGYVTRYHTDPARWNTHGTESKALGTELKGFFEYRQ